MPRNFPDMQSLKNNANMRNFRQPLEYETEEAYRSAFADFMRGIDIVESMEIRSSKGWNNWDEVDQLSLLMEAMNGQN